MSVYAVLCMNVYACMRIIHAKQHGCACVAVHLLEGQGKPLAAASQALAAPIPERRGPTTYRTLPGKQVCTHLPGRPCHEPREK